jgi:MFS family permease
MIKLNDRQKNALKWTLLMVALTNMPSLALSPATEQIRQYFNVSLPTVQTAMSFVNVIQIAVALIAMYLINRAVITKKLAVVLGQSFFVATVVFVLLFHESFWCVWCLSVLIGCSTGLFVTNAFGIMFDLFEPEERQKIAGYQTSCINGGGIAMSLAGGLLASFFWYGGYLVYSVGLILAILCAVNIPSYKTPKSVNGGEKHSKIDIHVFFYAAGTLLFMMTYPVVGQNLSTHLSKSFSNYSTLAGVCSSIQMVGGVCAGIIFGKLSKRLRDDIMVLGCCMLFLGFLLLSLFPATLPVILIAVFIAGASISMFNPWATYGVSVYSDPTNSAITSVIISSIAPSSGGFLSPVFFTNITNALSPDSTIFRYRFAAIFVLVFGLVIFLYNRFAARKTAA